MPNGLNGPNTTVDWSWPPRTATKYPNEVSNLSDLAPGAESPVAQHIHKFNRVSRSIHRTRKDSPRPCTLVSCYDKRYRLSERSLSFYETRGCSQGPSNGVIVMVLRTEGFVNSDRFGRSRTRCRRSSILRRSHGVN